MAQITIPGVYVEEVPSRGAPLKGAAYGAVGFVGKFSKGDVNTPVLCSSMNEVYDAYGSLVIGSSTLEHLYWLFKQKPSRVWICRVEGTASTVTIKDADVSPVDRIKVDASVDGVWADYVVGPPKMGIEIVTSAGILTGTFKFTVNYHYTHQGVAKTYTETFNNLSIDKTAVRYFPTVINAGSRIVKVADLNDIGIKLPGYVTSPLAGGVNPDYEGIGADKKGFDVLDTVDEISFYSCDDSASATHSIMIDHALACGDRTVLLDAPIYATLAAIKALGDAIDEERATFPGLWQKAYDPIMKVERSFPSSAFYIGLKSRIMPPQSPCNKKVYGSLGTERELSDADIWSLEQSKVSPITRWGNRGIRPRNGQTCSSNPNLNQQFRRYMCDWVMETIEENFGWAVSELHTPELRVALKESIGKWAEDLKGIQWIEDYSVTCDETNNPPSVREARKLYCDIAIRLFSVADYIIFRVLVSETAVIVSQAA